MKKYVLLGFFLFCTGVCTLRIPPTISGKNIPALRGVNWFGFENGQTSVDGLWAEAHLLPPISTQ